MERGKTRIPSETVPTTQHLASAYTLRSNPLNKPLLKALRDLHTNDTRLQLWFTVPLQAVAELKEPTATEHFGTSNILIHCSAIFLRIHPASATSTSELFRDGCSMSLTLRFLATRERLFIPIQMEQRARF